jgi:hypothetical protein
MALSPGGLKWILLMTHLKEILGQIFDAWGMKLSFKKKFHLLQNKMFVFTTTFQLSGAEMHVS